MNATFGSILQKMTFTKTEVVHGGSGDWKFHFDFVLYAGLRNLEMWLRCIGRRLCRLRRWHVCFTPDRDRKEGECEWMRGRGRKEG